MTAGSNCMPAFADLMRLITIKPRAEFRSLELDTDPQAGASAPEPAARTGGSVVSVSQSSATVHRARTAHAANHRLEFRRQSLAAGWPKGGPYDAGKS